MAALGTWLFRAKVLHSLCARSGGPRARAAALHTTGMHGALAHGVARARRCLFTQLSVASSQRNFNA
jgi:hypothetical protein